MTEPSSRKTELTEDMRKTPLLQKTRVFARTGGFFYCSAFDGGMQGALSGERGPCRPGAFFFKKGGHRGKSARPAGRGAPVRLAADRRRSRRPAGQGRRSVPAGRGPVPRGGLKKGCRRAHRGRKGKGKGAALCAGIGLRLAGAAPARAPRPSALPTPYRPLPEGAGVSRETKSGGESPRRLRPGVPKRKGLKAQASGR